MGFHAKKSKETLLKSKFYYVNFAPRLRNDEKLQKNGSLNRNLLHFCIGMVYFGESSHLGGSEYVWQRGVEGISGQVTGGRSLPYGPKKN